MTNTHAKALGLGLLIALSTPFAAQAQPAGVASLVAQARYWEGRQRQDLANQAWRRVLTLDPANADARRGLAGGPSAAVPAKAAAAQPKPATTRAVAKAPAAPRPPVDRAGDDRAAGFRALESGNLGSAGQRFQAALARSPRDADALGGLGIVKLRQNQFAEASDLLNRASRLGSPGKWAEALQSARFYATLGQARGALAAGRLDEAQRLTEGLAGSDFAERDPAFQLLGDIYEQQGRYADAAASYARSSGGAQASSGTQQGRTLRLQALQASSTGDNVQAEQFFQQGLVADPQDPWIRYEFARFLERQGRRADADSLIGSLSLSSEPEALYAAALLTSESGRTDAAERLIDRVPTDQRTAKMRDFALGLKADAAIARARAMAAQGQGPQAVAALRQIAAAPGITGDRQGAIAEAVYDLGDPAGASALARQALASGSSSAAGYEPIVRVLAKTGQDAFAMSAVQKAADLAGNSGEGQSSVSRLNGIAAASRADRMRTAGQFAPAFDMLQSAWAAAPGNTDVLSALARLYQSGTMYPQAAQTFQLVLAQTPNDKGAQMGLIDAASGARDFDLAEQAVARAIRANPNDHEVYLAAARMEKARGKDGASARYLKQARALYTRQNAPAGGFGSGNPFAAMPQGGGNPFAPAAAQTINPFALGTGTAPAYNPPPMAASGGYAAPQPFAAPGGYADTAYAGPAAQGYAAPDLGYPAQTYAGNAAITDPVLQSIDRDMRSLTADSGPRADMATSYRERTGETGLSALKELGASAEFSTDLAGGRISAKADAVVLDAGRPTGSGLQRFGRNGTAEAQGIVNALPSALTNAETQHAAGVALSAKFQSKDVTADVGTTPLGFEFTELQGGITATPRFSENTSGKAWVERRPVTDSVISYAGTRDPVSGQFWGQVMKTGGGASLSYDKDGTGFYADSSYYKYAGDNVRKNSGLQANVGAYMRALQTRSSKLTFGINANYQNFGNNQNFFSFGHGGYFSPQSFLSLSFPVRYNYTRNALDLAVSVAPGYQSYEQHASPLYPTDPAAQAALESLKAQNDDVRSNYDSISQTGFGLAASGSAYYRVGARTRIGGEVNVNTFGDYNEFRTVLGIKQKLGDQN